MLELSAVLSALDATKGEFWATLTAPAFAGLHGVSWQLFTRLTLESQAQTTHLAKPSVGFMAEYLVKNLHKFMEPSPEYLEFLRTTDVRGVNGFTGTLWRHQVGLDGRYVFQNTNRTYALLHHYPTLHRNTWQARHQEEFYHLPDFFRELTGASVSTFLLACEALYANYVRFFNENLHFNPPWLQAYWRVPEEGRPQLSVTDLKQYLNEIYPFLSEISITREKALNFLQHPKLKLPADELPGVLDALISSLDDVRALLHEAPYNTGQKCFMPLPLEVKPLIELPDGKLLLPNLRSFLRAVSRLPHVLIRRAPDRKRALNAYGWSLKAYACALTEDRLRGTDMTVVAEFPYSASGRGGMRSAADPLLAPGKPVIQVEYKANRMHDDALSRPTDDGLTPLLNLLQKTVLKGEDKRKDLPEHHGAWRAADLSRDLTVMVYGESVPGADAQFYQAIVRDPTYAELKARLGEFLPLSIEDYERHCEVAHDTGQNMHDLLMRSAEEFVGRSDDELKLTAHGHLDDKWPQNVFVDQFQGPRWGRDSHGPVQIP
ncbi:hypothetical protein V3W47_13920 [Deinococcus sp. YIM 134068]|uniref:hypothetical protein n=1 Tax=Deinococcus lichenicola TaxID=3118910 RepID=UPI002F94D72C